MPRTRGKQPVPQSDANDADIPAGDDVSPSLDATQQAPHAVSKRKRQAVQQDGTSVLSVGEMVHGIEKHVSSYIA